MKFLLETTDLEQIRTAHSWGIVDGVMLDRSKLQGDLESRLSEICRIVDGPVAVNATATESSAIVSEGRELASRHANAVFMVPVTPDGMSAVRRLSDEGIRSGAASVRTSAQALLAAKAGAEYLSIPMDGGIDVAGRAVGMIANYGFESEVIAVGIRGPDDVLQAMRVGTHAIGISFETIEQLFSHA